MIIRHDLKKYDAAIRIKTLFINIVLAQGLEDFVKKLGPLMYWNGKGELITRTEYMRWKFRNNKEEKISVDESGMTQFDPLLSWEDHSACWKMQYRGSLGESLLHILIMGNSLIHTKIARTLIRQFPRTVIDVIEVSNITNTEFCYVINH